MHSRFPSTLLLLCLIVGPLCLGSYYGEWRWPLLYISWITGLTLVFWPIKNRPSHGRRLHGFLVFVIAILLVQGLWMWWNARFDFTRDATVYSNGVPWSLIPRNVIPFPEWPGAIAKNEAWDRMTYIAPALLLVWGVARWASCRPYIRAWVMKTVFFTGLAIAIMGLVFRWTGAEGPFWSKSLFTAPGMENEFQLFFATYRSPGIATAYINIGLIFGLSMSLRQLYAMQKEGKGLGLALAYLLGTLVIFNGVMAAGSKAGMALAGAALLLCAILNAGVIWHLIKNAGRVFPKSSTIERVLVGVGVLLTVLLTGLSWAGTTVYRWQSAMDSGFPTMEARMQVNQSIMNIIQDSNWGAMGFGPGSFYPLFPFYCNGTDLKGVYFYAHNDFLQTLVEWGWLGFMLFAVLIGGACVILLWNSLSRRKQPRQSRGDLIVHRGFLISILIFLVHSTIDFPFQIESIAMTMAVLIGVGWGSAISLSTKQLCRASSSLVEKVNF